MRTGDICAILSGAVYPMVLRNKGDHNFQLIGPALMYALMNGESAKACQEGEFLEQEFEIL
jgi:hypothetical protein